MEYVENFGILASIAWNSNGWTRPLTKADLKNVNFGYVKQHQDSADVLNFGHNQYPAEADGTYIGYSPALKQLPAVDWLGAVFFLSTDHRRGQRCVVGVYGFPQTGAFTRHATHRLFKHYDGGNVRALVNDIVHFTTPVDLDDDIVAHENLLPAGKSLAKRGFNYLTSENVINLLRRAVRLNRHDERLAALLHRLETDPAAPPDEDAENGLGGLGGLGRNPDADSLGGLAQLELRMQKLQPQEKARVSTYIERGYIATSVKRHTDYKCLLCQVMGLNPIGFIKSNGIPYVETHHVDPVANQNTGALGLANILTLCANHHRQMHYGDVRLVKQTKTQFTFAVDAKQFVIKKIKP